MVRVRAVRPDAIGPWEEDDQGYVDVPLTRPLAELQIAKRLPTLNIRPGEHRPHIRGKIREYVAL